MQTQMNITDKYCTYVHVIVFRWRLNSDEFSVFYCMFVLVFCNFGSVKHFGQRFKCAIEIYVDLIC